MDNILSVLKERQRVRDLEQALWDSGYVYTVAQVRADHDVLCWIKDEHQRMLAISPAYEKYFGIKNEDYRGKTDREMWGNLGDDFTDNDEIAMIQRIGFLKEEKWLTGNGVSERGVVLKIYQHDDENPTTYGRVLHIVNSDGRIKEPKILA